MYERARDSIEKQRINIIGARWRIIETIRLTVFGFVLRDCRVLVYERRSR